MKSEILSVRVEFIVMAYDFRSLSDKDFEDLVQDLLQKELGIHFESFKKGRDEGIDLRYSVSKGSNEIIVQAKHYINSSFSQLKSSLNGELEKVKRLKPKRYIVTTSLGLSPKNKEEILEIFDPYIQSTTDIFGCDDLNGLLRAYTEVEKVHFKLWMASTVVLERILDRYVENSRDFEKEEIIDKVKIFVPTRAFDEAIQKLIKFGYIVIKGEPGIGKTTLAQMIIWRLIGESSDEEELELVKIEQNDINQARKYFKSQQKQIFYIDDFLGSNHYDLKSNSKYDSHIQSFISILERNNKANPKYRKYLILTSRTNILNEGRFNLQGLDKANIKNSEYEVSAGQYSRYEKALILYNHLYKLKNSSDAYETLFKQIVKDQFYEELIDHKNYNPRIIQFITDYHELPDSHEFNYQEFILDKLNNPQDIWKMPFNKLDIPEKLFLETLLTFPLNSRFKVNEDSFKKVFEQRLLLEGEKYNGFIYNDCLKKLLGSFIVRNKNFETYSLTFFNPSIRDFLKNHIARVPESISPLINSSRYVEQLNEILTMFENLMTDEQKELVLKLVRESKLNINEHSSDDYIEILFMITRLFDCNNFLEKLEENEINPMEIFKKIDFSCIRGDQHVRNFLCLIEYYSEFEKYKNYFHENLVEIIAFFIEHSSWLDDLETNLEDYFSNFDIEAKEFFGRNCDKDLLIDACDSFFNKKAQDSFSGNFAIYMKDMENFHLESDRIIEKFNLPASDIGHDILSEYYSSERVYFDSQSDHLSEDYEIKDFFPKVDFKRSHFSDDVHNLFN